MLATQEAIAAALSSGQRVRDAEFDRAYPLDVRRMSARFWTPVDVAVTAGRWLASQRCASVLDVGSGVGKFGIVAQLSSSCRYCGLEQRPRLVEIARATAKAYGARVRFVHSTVARFDPEPFDAFYLFNPFGENLYQADECFDTVPELSALRYLSDLSIVEHWLDCAPRDTCFLTYHGFGGSVPSNYQLIRAQPKGSGHLRLWRKGHSGPAPGFKLEAGAPRAPKPGRR